MLAGDGPAGLYRTAGSLDAGPDAQGRDLVPDRDLVALGVVGPDDIDPAASVEPDPAVPGTVGQHRCGKRQGDLRTVRSGCQDHFRHVGVDLEDDQLSAGLEDPLGDELLAARSAGGAAPGGAYAVLVEEREVVVPVVGADAHHPTQLSRASGERQLLVGSEMTLGRSVSEGFS
jgi:hypothetical protein